MTTQEYAFRMLFLFLLVVLHNGDLVLSLLFVFFHSWGERIGLPKHPTVMALMFQDVVADRLTHHQYGFHNVNEDL